MRAVVRALILTAFAVFSLVACGGGSSSPPPPPVDTELDWNQGNWDQEDWQ
jgi:hypothetical protein